MCTLSVPSLKQNYSLVSTVQEGLDNVLKCLTSEANVDKFMKNGKQKSNNNIATSSMSVGKKLKRHTPFSTTAKKKRKTNKCCHVR